MRSRFSSACGLVFYWSGLLSIVGIALRGYRSHQGKSDEAMEHQTALPNAKVAVGANRFATITAAVDRDPSIGVVILDDGFQHRALARNLDLVLIDATCSRLDGSLFALFGGWGFHV